MLVGGRAAKSPFGDTVKASSLHQASNAMPPAGMSLIMQFGPDPQTAIGPITLRMDRLDFS